ncbi:AAA family ATPase [Corynebacterium qintianiae]|uniref:AAA family ATPase n=1 Tax=Corynebacterium qintianiae TaxID=2709392 RepID=A0A7T0PEK1_9CORY|nr:AAA family ATPase [Corynebacterium qintianiae]QPK83998.1 AAA family ATPase [Corynebacterium qintianiae]
MKIHSISLKNVRAVEHLELTGIPDTGVMLIHGDNEAGKSTVLDAIDVVLNFKHSSGDSRVKVLAPVGRDVGPEVTLSATVGPYTFTVRKVFLRKKRSELTITAPRREQYTGREADDKLDVILSEHLDTALASTLFLRQGEIDPGIAAAGIPSITRALDAGTHGAGEAGGAVSGTEDTELMARIDAEYQRYFTAKGGQKASFTELGKRRDAAAEKLSGLRAEVDRLASFVDEVARREGEISGIKAELPDAVVEEAARAEEAAAAKVLAEKAEAAKAEEKRAALDHKRSTEDIEARMAARQRVEELARDAEKLGSGLDAAREAVREEAAKVGKLTAQRDAAKRKVVTVRETVKAAEVARQRARSRVRAAELADVVARLGAVDEELSALRAAQPIKAVADSDIRALEKAREELTLQRRLRDAASAKLEVTGPEAAVVALDGMDVEFPGSATVGIHDGSTLALGEFEVVYRAGQGSAGPGADLDAAERAYAERLAALGCGDIEEARRRRDEHTELASSLQSTLRRREDVLGTRDADELRAEHTRLSEQAAGSDVEDPCGTEEEAEAALTRAQRHLDEATDALEHAEAVLAPWAEQKEATALAVLEARAESKAAEVSAARAQLDAAEEKTPLAELESAQEAAKQALDAATARCAELVRQLAEANPTLAADLFEGAQVRVRNLRTRLADAERRVAELTGRIEQAAGVAEQTDRAEAELDAAVSEFESATRRAEAVRLLRETMVRHRDEARARYAAPFAAALNRYASRVFGPDVEFTLGESLDIEARTLGGATVSLDQLSGGAKEQLALLVRFAIAELAGTGQTGRTPVPVIVDDALGATDPNRLELMNSLFNQVGRESQVFVLTCFPRRFDWVNVAKVASISELKQGGI